MFCSTTVRAACCWSRLCEDFAQHCGGGCSDTPGPRGGCGQAVGQGLLCRIEKMLPCPRGPRRKGLLLFGPLGLLQSSQQVCSDFQGEQAARVRTCPAKTCSEPAESWAALLPLSSLPSLPEPTSPLVISAVVNSAFYAKPCGDSILLNN